MGLLNLPPELLSRIIEFSIPFDFENFMLSCRTVYTCGSSIIAVHNKHKREWTSIGLISHKRASTAFKHLCGIVKDPIVADYVEYADLHGRILQSSPTGYHIQKAWNCAAREDAALMEAFENLVVDSPYLVNNIDGVSAWRNTLLDDSEDEEIESEDGEVDSEEDDDDDSENAEKETRESRTLLFLLAQLRNIKKLTLPPAWEVAIIPDWEERTLSGPWQLLETIMRLSHEPKLNAPCAQLKILQTLDSCNYTTRTRLASLSPFLAMKNLEELYATSLLAAEDGYTETPFTWPYPDLQSSLRRLELVSCCMDGKSIGNLLAHTPLLRSLRYSHSTKWHGCLYDWNAAEFVAETSKYCGDQLIDLSITVDEIFGKITNGVVTLKGFNCLENLEVDTSIFSGPSLESGERRGDEGCPPSEGFKEWEVEDVPKLVEILPSTLKSLRLFDGRLDENHYAVSLSLLKDFSAGRDWLLSDLEELEFRQRLPRAADQGVEAVRLQAEAIGAVYFAGTSIQPVWRRSFGRKHGILGRANRL